MPSRRCSGSSSAAPAPTRRTVPPATCETPIQAPRAARDDADGLLLPLAAFLGAALVVLLARFFVVAVELARDVRVGDGVVRARAGDAPREVEEFFFATSTLSLEGVFRVGTRPGYGRGAVVLWPHAAPSERFSHHPTT